MLQDPGTVPKGCPEWPGSCSRDQVSGSPFTPQAGVSLCSTLRRHLGESDSRTRTRDPHLSPCGWTWPCHRRALSHEPRRQPDERRSHTCLLFPTRVRGAGGSFIPSDGWNPGPLLHLAQKTKNAGLCETGPHVTDLVFFHRRGCSPDSEFKSGPVGSGVGWLACL